jgi:hypothetical protein
VQGRKSASTVESRRHSKVEFGSEAENVNEGEGSLVGPEGPESIVVSGIAACAVVVTTPKASTSAIATETWTERCRDELERRRIGVMKPTLCPSRGACQAGESGIDQHPNEHIAFIAWRRSCDESALEGTGSAR